MSVDWITVAAQILNFLVLVWLLRHFLYGPVIRAMDRREAEISDRLRDAHRQGQEAEAEAARLRELQEAFEAERKARLAAADAEAESYRQSLHEGARQDVAERREEWQRNVEEEKQAFLRDARERSAEAFSAMAQRALRDLADETLEDRIACRFAGVLAELDETDAAAVRTALSARREPVAVRTAFDLSEARRSEVAAALRNRFGEDLEVKFDRSPDLACGLEIRAGGQVVRWSLDGFLDDFETQLRNAVAQNATGTAGRAAE